MKTIRPTTEFERNEWPNKPLVNLAIPFVDERGEIQPLVDASMESCVLITSKAGSVRANHYHKTDWHYCYVLEGEIRYYHRPHGSSEIPEELVISKGQMFFTPPMVDHTMVFEVDTQFLTWGRNSRAQQVYEADVSRIPPLHLIGT